MDVKSKDPREAWTKLKKEFLHAKILDVKDLLDAFQKIKFGTNLKANPTKLIEAIERNDAQIVVAINKKYKKDDFLLLTHVFTEPPDEEHKTCTSKHADSIELLTVMEAKKTAKAHWKRFIRKKGNGDTGKTEDVSTAKAQKPCMHPGPKPKKDPTPKKRFKGDCRNCCGKQGHKAADGRGGGDEIGAGGEKQGCDLLLRMQQERSLRQGLPKQEKDQARTFLWHDLPGST
jgi:hypothetical protein